MKSTGDADPRAWTMHAVQGLRPESGALASDGPGELRIAGRTHPWGR
jgi:hypothetical protein